MTAPPALVLEDVEFAYGHVRVLRGVSFEVAPGEAVALLGTNGAGKSTLLRVAAGLETAQHGSVRIDGADVTALPAEARCRRGVALAVGGKGVFPDLTVHENLRLGGYVLGDELTERIEGELERFPRLRQRLGGLAGSLSGGEQQQLVLAQALLRRPTLLCIDELSLGLAPGLVSQLLEVVAEVQASGTTCLLVEQSLNVAARLCPRALFLEKGVVRFDGVTGDLLDREDLARAVFLGGRTPGAG